MNLQEFEKLDKERTQGEWRWLTRVYDGKWIYKAPNDDFDDRIECTTAQVGEGEDRHKTVIKEWASYADDSGLDVAKEDQEWIAACSVMVPALIRVANEAKELIASKTEYNNLGRECFPQEYMNLYAALKALEEVGL